ncbi:MAG: HAD-IA family hydrolase [Deltaproteobacteria bacterium]|nr:HAD-IA family hydrolase [Deltaproteobacteria bacterium]
MKISYIWFDIGYTLLRMKREVTYRQALKTFGEDISVEILEREFHWVDKLFMREYPGVFLKGRGVYMPWFLGVLNYRLGISLDVAEVDKCWEKIQLATEDYWIPFGDVHEVLGELRDSSLRMGVISNWDRSAKYLLKRHGLIGYFEHCIISSEVGLDKPDPAIFNLAMQQAEADPRECVYVGDNYYDDAVGSRQVGMQALILNRFGTLGVEEIDDAPIIQNLGQIKDYIA